jgi:hypothetical protein
MDHGTAGSHEVSCNAPRSKLDSIFRARTNLGGSQQGDLQIPVA